MHKKHWSEKRKHIRCLTLEKPKEVDHWCKILWETGMHTHL